MKPSALFLGAAASLVLAFSITPSEALTISLKSEARVPGANVTIGDVVTPDPAISAALLQLPLGMSPALNEHKAFSREMVAATIAAHPEGNGVELTGSARCVIDRPARIVAPQDVAGVILPELKKATNSEGQIKIDEFAPDAPVLVPEGNVAAQAQLVPTALFHPWASALIRYYVNGEMVATSSVRFRWSWQLQVWQATRNISPGEDYNPADFRLTTIDAIKADGKYMTTLPPVGEQVTGRLIPSGALLTPAYLTPKKIVQRGEQVTVNYTQANFKVTMKGIALQDGVRGQMIPVQNTLSQKSLFAKVVDSSTLEVAQ